MKKIFLLKDLKYFFKKNLSLKKDELLYDLNAVDIPPILMCEEEEKNLILKKIDNQYITKFCNVVINNISNNKLNYMYNNVKSLKISPIFFKNMRYMNRKVSSYYNCVKNEIKYIKHLKDKVIFHELLHMASTIKKEDGSVFSGFYQITNLGNYMGIGRGVNEGYTQLLTQRYFDVNHKSYSLEVLIVSKIENIIGREKMENIYFSADLPALIKELYKYKNEKDILLFFYAVDFLGTIYCKKNIIEEISIIQKAYYTVVEFLIDIKYQSLIDNKVNLNLAKKNLLDYSKNLEHTIISKKNYEKISLITKSDLNEIIDRYMLKLKINHSKNIMF